MVSSTLPSTHRTLAQRFHARPFTIEDAPTPLPTPGLAIFRIGAAGVISYQRDVYNANRQYLYPMPLITGLYALSRVLATDADAVILEPGMLVLFDPFF